MMRRVPTALAFLVLVAGPVLPALPVQGAETRAAAPVRSAVPGGEAFAAPEPRRVRAIIDGVPDTGQFLPDTSVLARVNDRVIRAGDFIRSYFSAWAPDRSASDSAGRVEFLEALINKEVLAFVAQKGSRPLGFDDRAVMREHTQRVLSNVLYQRAILDSLVVAEEDIRRTYEQSGYEQWLRRIVFDERASAERTRRDLKAGRIRWAEAFAQSARAAQDTAAGDLGWLARSKLDPVAVDQLGGLGTGAVSGVVNTRDGYAVFQVVARRPVTQMPLDYLRSQLEDQLRQEQIAFRTARLRRAWLGQMGVVYDSVNIALAAARFPESSPIEAGPQGPVVNLSGELPEFAAEDTARVLARYRGGQLTLGEFLEHFGSIDVIRRPSIHRPFLLIAQVDAFVLEPHMARIAAERGLETDPMSVYLIEQKRNLILVEHLYQDSILARLRIRPEDRRSYYDEHLADYQTYPSVRYAWIVRESRAGADSIVNLLGAGARAEDVVHRDSLAGNKSSYIETRPRNYKGMPYHKVLFEELKTGQAMVEGPDRDGKYLVLQVLSSDPGRQLSLREAENMVDEAVQSITADEMLKSFCARHRAKFRIESHPELVMRIRLVDPAGW